MQQSIVITTRDMNKTKRRDNTKRTRSQQGIIITTKHEYNRAWIGQTTEV